MKNFTIGSLFALQLIAPALALACSPGVIMPKTFDKLTYLTNSIEREVETFMRQGTGFNPLIAKLNLAPGATDSPYIGEIRSMRYERIHDKDEQYSPRGNYTLVLEQGGQADAKCYQMVVEEIVQSGPCGDFLMNKIQSVDALPACPR